MRPLLVAVVISSLSLACSSSSDGGGSGASGGTSGTGGASGAGGSSGAATGGSAGAAGSATCADLGAPTCFSNYDCANASDRCHNLGSEASPDVCCVAGPRGEKAAGEACSSDLDCKSSICIDSLCSDVCTNPDDCPLGMKDCTPIAFSGSPDNWCLPSTP